jgi:hypothetical protein
MTAYSKDGAERHRHLAVAIDLHQLAVQSDGFNFHKTYQSPLNRMEHRLEVRHKRASGLQVVACLASNSMHRKISHL